MNRASAKPIPPPTTFSVAGSYLNICFTDNLALHYFLSGITKCMLIVLNYEHCRTYMLLQVKNDLIAVFIYIFSKLGLIRNLFKVDVCFYKLLCLGTQKNQFTRN